LGDAKTSAGALLVVAKAEHEVRIEVGRGLEGTLNDARAGRIIRDVIVPEFREQRFYEGIRKGIEAIHAALGGEYGATEREVPVPGSVLVLGPLFFFLFLIFVLRRWRNRLSPAFGSSNVLPWIIASEIGRRSHA